ncbi:MAG TPA: dinitrogenase iron-molybdenum cofactor biosynthesis protein [Desulfobacteraceae bacterium]|nr:dinitrogenase iron-molybdenum cofactor biosynthesis protein [Desulfobacteraceae bacterium]
MKIAVSSRGRDLDAPVDPRFGRAACILIVDTESLEFQCIDNEANKNAFKGAGIQAAAAICDAGAQVLLTGFCGPNAFKALDAADIRVANDVQGTVREAILCFKAKKYEFASKANTQGHW